MCVNSTLLCFATCLFCLLGIFFNPEDELPRFFETLLNFRLVVWKVDPLLSHIYLAGIYSYVAEGKLRVSLVVTFGDTWDILYYLGRYFI
jgi:hypothetical protein